MKFFSFLSLLIFFSMTSPAFAEVKKYGEILCNQRELYRCVEIRKGDDWKSLWPNEEERKNIQRINRINIELHEGLKIAVPRNFDWVPFSEFSPLSHHLDTSGEKQVLVNLNWLVWGAYNSEGELVNWGPAAGGQDWCQDINEACRTPIGEFSILYKEGEPCVSHTFPTPEGDGTPMPYCMFFFKGFALHGSYEVPGYNASHGCVRLFPEDAKWLNEDFIELPNKKNAYRGTKVIIEPY